MPVIRGLGSPRSYLDAAKVRQLLFSNKYLIYFCISLTYFATFGYAELTFRAFNPY